MFYLICITLSWRKQLRYSSLCIYTQCINVDLKICEIGSYIYSFMRVTHCIKKGHTCDIRSEITSEKWIMYHYWLLSIPLNQKTSQLQVRTITTTAASNFAATNFSSPKLNSNQNITEDNDSSCSSRGVSPQAPPPPPPLLPPQSSIALDLTPPRSSSSSQIFNPFHHLPPPPLGFPASLLTPTTTANAVAALANLSSFSPLVPPPRRNFLYIFYTCFRNWNFWANFLLVNLLMNFYPVCHDI